MLYLQVKAGVKPEDRDEKYGVILAGIESRLIQMIGNYSKNSALLNPELVRTFS